MQKAGLASIIAGVQGAVQAGQQVVHDPNMVAVAGRHALAKAAPAKRVLALLSTYNDRDFIKACVRHLRREGLFVCAIDNWSTDGTWELLQQLRAEDPDGIVHLEQFPPEGRSEHFEWQKIVLRKVALSEALDFDWYTQHDSDELRYAPSPHITSAEAFSRIDAAGFNAVDHTQVEFRPVDACYPVDAQPTVAMRHFEFGNEPFHFRNIRAWKKQTSPVDLVSSGGHIAHFVGRKVYPIKSLMNHYGLRSSEHAKKKLFVDRLPRAKREIETLQWHTHLSDFVQKLERQGWLWKKDDLMQDGPETLQNLYLLPRLADLLFARQ